MKRQMVRFLQKRKFRLLTRWKSALKENLGAPIPAYRDFPYNLIFKAFDEVIRLLRTDSNEVETVPPISLLEDLSEEAAPTPDQYMELFLSGRDVLGEFVEKDSSFHKLFSDPDREEFRSAVEQAFKQLIDREMREYSNRFTPHPHR